MTGTKVSLTVEAGTAWITLDGPERRNALDAQAARDLAAICDTVDADPAAGVAVITGTGRTFCSGADTAILNRIRTASPDRAYDGLDELYAGFRRFAGLKVPTVAAVNGAAVGAGLNLALAADLRVASTGAVFISGFAPLGMHPGGGHLHLIARAAGAGAAANLGVFGQRMGADQALAVGLVSAVVDDDAELPATVRSMVAHLAADPALARALAADLHRTVYDPGAWDRAVEIERARQMWSLARNPKES
jgi:enoyl-CoA hydratase